SGAGFYVNAMQPPWAGHYRMYDYVTRELPDIARGHLAISDAQSISGHSMGGHGALICALKNPGMYRSVSAFAPICHPAECPWGQLALGTYLGDDREAWSDWDATLLIADADERLPILVDQGADDEFLAEQLHPEALQAACKATEHPLDLRMREGYDHSYYFVATFIDDHLRHHARALGLTPC
ncbi:MAG: alpha/beta hydrolase-fold protein, partial [Xanthomonadales bacterium]|nr:alpha/beta hydrolase-fold protein [Xanthomonadales bacterium]